jgi:hypothetical protein
MTGMAALSSIASYCHFPCNRVFLNNDEDEEKDLRLQAQIRSLHWMTPERLEAGVRLDIEVRYR